MANEPSHPGPIAPDPPSRPRLVALDVLRGFALCGILVVNIPIIASVGPDEQPAWLVLVASQRFLPLFALLFGAGAELMLEAARRRTPHPHRALLRRLLALAVIGLLHHLLWPGEILLPYAVIGLVVLLPAGRLPRPALAALAVLVTVGALAAGGGGPLLVAGLFLTGAVLVRYGLVTRAERSARGPAAVGVLLAAFAVPALWWQLQAGDGDFGRWLHIAGLLMAGVYACVVLVLLHTPLQPVLRTLFIPLGRMALTNYLSATAVVTAAAFLGLHGDTTVELLAVAGTVLAAQWVFAVLWLRRFGQGPVEWLWRLATWGRRGPVAAPGAVPAG